METNNYEIIDTFLANWKQQAKEYYINASIEYKEAVKNTPEGWYTVNGYKFLYSNKRDSEFIEKHGKGTLQIIKYDMYRIDEILEKEVISKRIKLITSVEKKAGKIQDASKLYIGIDGNINGYIIGEVKTVYVNTIYAGGHNIQCLHYRILIK